MRPETRALVALARAKAAVLAQEQRASEAAVLAALTAWLGSKDAIHATGLPGQLMSMLTGLGLDGRAVEQAARMVLSERMSGRTRGGAPAPTRDMPATRLVASQEPSMRSQYLLSAAKRLSDAEDWDKALDVERRYLRMHVAAGRNRRAAALKVDAIDAPVLVWRTAADDRVEPICASLEGRLFTRGNPPGGLLPGAVHLRCRCHAEAFGRGPLVNWGNT